jgi:hypothetical protein
VKNLTQNHRIKHEKQDTNPICASPMPSRDAWAKSWQKHRSKVGLPGYELPAGDEQDLLATARTPQKERARLKRITAEFERAFTTFYDVGAAVSR